MNIVLGITTYNRLEYLKQTLDGWDATRNKQHDWAVIVADDGSTDGTLPYLADRLKDIPHHVLSNQRRGVHHQTNTILKHCSDIEFDFGFKIDDDLIFKKKGWDELYLSGMKKFDHLVFHDPQWKRVKRQREPVQNEQFECRSYWNDLQGAFWTFTPRVISTIGYFDLKNFGLCGFGHRDYTYRCCKAGFNCFDNIFDMRGSLEYLELIKHKYHSAPDRDSTWQYWNTYQLWQYKISKFNDERLYIPYKDEPVDIYGHSLIKL